MRVYLHLFTEDDIVYSWGSPLQIFEQVTFLTRGRRFLFFIYPDNVGSSSYLRYDLVCEIVLDIQLDGLKHNVAD